MYILGIKDFSINEHPMWEANWYTTIGNKWSGSSVPDNDDDQG